MKFAFASNPAKLAAAEWGRVARDAVIKSLAITAKHRDGFARLSLSLPE